MPKSQSQDLFARTPVRQIYFFHKEVLLSKCQHPPFSNSAFYKQGDLFYMTCCIWRYIAGIYNRKNWESRLSLKGTCSRLSDLLFPPYTSQGTLFKGFNSLCTTFNQLISLPERYSVFFLQSSISISAVPDITSSSSRASNRLIRLGSRT